MPIQMTHGFRGFLLLCVKLALWCVIWGDGELNANKLQEISMRSFLLVWEMRLGPRVCVLSARHFHSRVEVFS